MKKLFISKAKYFRRFVGNRIIVLEVQNYYFKCYSLYFIVYNSKSWSEQNLDIINTYLL